MSCTIGRCQQNGLRLKLSKCVFNHVKYFGHMLTGGGVRAGTEKVKTIAEMPGPQNREELHRFLGIIAYLSKFLPHHSEVSASLRDLMKQDAACWTPCQDRAFQQLHAMVTTAVLAFYDHRISGRLILRHRSSTITCRFRTMEGEHPFRLPLVR